ncbi:hypothetical protein [Helicobacter equorum]|uniref:hypothetical protein n=1 Tax=Helicobacter equorum TaxID=361872 RepID=UPI000CF15814|nr:hypothetical protein [Helicobacter equorum]
MKKNLSLLLLICMGVGIGVGISKIYKHTHEQKFIPNQYTPQDSQDIDSTQTQNLEQSTQESTLDSVITQDIFYKTHQIPQFQEYPATMYQGQFMKADESCINCEGGLQEALKRGIIDFGGKYALYTLKPNNAEIMLGAVNVENGEVLEFPILYKEVTPPFKFNVFAKPQSNLIWVQGVDSKNNDIYTIGAYILKNGSFQKIQSFEIVFSTSENLTPQSLQQDLSDSSQQGIVIF